MSFIATSKKITIHQGPQKVGKEEKEENIRNITFY
jgi:hypothetical protein